MSRIAVEAAFGVLLKYVNARYTSLAKNKKIKLGLREKLKATSSNSSSPRGGDLHSFNDVTYLQDKERGNEKEKERERERERQEKEKDAVLSLGVPETNTQGVRVIQRVQSKLTGTDFNKTKGAAALSIEEQVDRLISEATSEENLCMLRAHIFTF